MVSLDEELKEVNQMVARDFEIWKRNPLTYYNVSVRALDILERYPKREDRLKVLESLCWLYSSHTEYYAQQETRNLLSSR
jgi:hypothetical protein